MKSPSDHATTNDSPWEQRIAELWDSIDACGPDAFVAAMDALSLELLPKSAVGLFERASAQDSTDNLVP